MSQIFPNVPPSTSTNLLARLFGLLDAQVVKWAIPRGQMGLSIFRVLFGVFALYELLINYAQRHYLFGPDGVWPYDLFLAEMKVTDSVSLYAASADPMWFELVYHAHIIVVCLWLLGFATRFLTPVLWLLHWSIHERFSLLWDGGDNLSYLLLIYLSFADVGAYFAPLGSGTPWKVDLQRPWQVARGILHNSARFACIAQIAILYFNAGVAKLDGKYWQNGTALYYSLRAAEYNVAPEMSKLVWDSPVLLSAGTYFTLVFQVSFPLILWLGRPWMRVLIVAAAVGFHLGILTMMGLVTFGLFMLAYEPILLSDSEYSGLGRILLQVRSSLLRLLGRFVAPGTTDEAKQEAAGVKAI